MLTAGEAGAPTDRRTCVQFAAPEGFSVCRCAPGSHPPGFAVAAHKLTRFHHRFYKLV